jgi:hypothetical protein
MATTRILFGRITIRFGYTNFDDEDIVIIVHLEWNLIFFARENETIIAYNMDHKKVHVIPVHVFRYGRCTVKKEFIYRAYYLPYVPLFLDSLAEQ